MTSSADLAMYTLPDDHADDLLVGCLGGADCTLVTSPGFLFILERVVVVDAALLITVQGDLLVIGFS